MGALIRAFWAALEHRVSAGERGLRLLRENLTPTQLAQYDERQYFEVIGGQTGRRYRVHLGDAMNVDELDASGRCVNKMCFQPEGPVVKGDVLLAQKIALELYERDALAVANRYPVSARDGRRSPRSHRHAR